ncbi:MAG: tetratricopeptide repeat protein [Planctomycetota bacterium]|jgi:tetratricopeptide (TPR) repeat protein
MQGKPATYRDIIRHHIDDVEDGVSEFIQRTISSVKAGVPEQLLEAAKSELEKEEDDRKSAWLKLLVAGICFRKRDFETLESLISDMPDDISRSGPERAHACYYLALAAKAKTDLKLAKELCKKGIGFYWDDFDKTGMQLTNTLGICLVNEGNYEEALMHFNTAMKYCESSESKRIPTGLYINIAVCYIKLAEPEKANETYKKALREERKRQNHRDIALLLANMASLQATQKKYKMAVEYGEMAYDAMEKLEDTVVVTAVLLNLGLPYMMLGELEAAIDYADKAVVIAESARGKILIAETRLLRGTILARMNDPDAAEYLLEAINYADELAEGKEPEMLDMALIEYGKILCEKKDPAGYLMLQRAERLLATRGQHPHVVSLRDYIKDYIRELPDSLKGE